MDKTQTTAILAPGSSAGEPFTLPDRRRGGEEALRRAAGPSPLRGRCGLRLDLRLLSRRPLEEQGAVGGDPLGEARREVVRFPRIGGEVEELRVAGLDLEDELPLAIGEAQAPEGVIGEEQGHPR